VRLPLPLPLGAGGQLQWGRRRLVKLVRGERGSEGGYGCGRGSLAMKVVVRGVVEVMEGREEEVGDEVVVMLVVVENFMVLLCVGVGCVVVVVVVVVLVVCV